MRPEMATLNQDLDREIKGWRIFLDGDIRDYLIRLTSDLRCDRSIKIHRTHLIEVLRGSLKEIVTLREKLQPKECDPFGGPLS